MAFADLVANLHLNIANFSSGLSRASRQMRDFARRTQDSYGLAATALNKHNLHLKDTVRIMHGIVVAQAFYQSVGAITDATRALWDFNVALDYMHVTYSALFGDTKVASDFMSVLQEHAVETIFDYQGLADASKKLLAYGIEYENLMFIMEGLTNLGAMSGDSAALDRIALALGQIYTKGKLSAEEMRQLANAYIPITEILQDKFGLTGDDLKRVGDLGLPAADVINAIVDYANENFGSVGDAAMYTITGLQNRIVDSLKVIGSQMLKPITTAYKSFLAYVARGIEGLRAAFQDGGMGGVFEYLVPNPETQQAIRQFVANVKNLFMSLVSVGVVVGQVFGNVASVFVTAFNIVAPIVVGFVNVLASFLNSVLQTREGVVLLRTALVVAAGAFVVLKVQALAALAITAVTKAVIGLAKALMLLASIVTKHPILALLAGITIALVGVSASSNKANSSISGLFDKLSGLGGGSSSTDVLKNIKQGLTDSSSAADQFSNRLEGAAGAASDLSKAIGGAGKAADKAAKKTGGLLSFDEVYKLPEESDSSGGSGTGTGGLLEDLGALADGFGGLGEALIPEIPDFTEFIDGFTDDLFGGLEESITGKIKTAGIGAAIGAGLGAIIGAVFGGAPGAAMGAKIGMWAGGLVGFFWEPIKNFFTDVTKKIAIWCAELFRGISDWWSDVSNGFGEWWGKLAAGFRDWWNGLKSGFSEWWNGVTTGLRTWWTDTKTGFTNWWSDTKAGFSTWWNNTKQGFADMLSGTKAGISNWWSETKTGFNNWWTETKTGFNNWLSSTKAGLNTWWSNTKAGFNTWSSNAKSTLSTWWSETKTGFSDWWTNTKTGFNDWKTKVSGSVTEAMRSAATTIAQRLVESYNSTTSKLDEIKNAWSTKFNSIRNNLNTWWSTTDNAFVGWFRSIISTIDSRLDNIRTSWSTKWDAIKATLGGWFGGLAKNMTTWLNDHVWSPISDFFNLTTFWNKIKSKLDDIKDKFRNWWTEVKNIFSGGLNFNASASTSGASVKTGHATGGIFNREHVARFAEGNKAEAIIPLENNSAMQPFVDAVANGLVGQIAPLVAGSSGANTMPPLYVGTLIADDRGLKQLYKKFEVIQLQENERRGTPGTPVFA